MSKDLNLMLNSIDNQLYDRGIIKKNSITKTFPHITRIISKQTIQAEDFMKLK